MDALESLKSWRRDEVARVPGHWTVVFLDRGIDEIERLREELFKIQCEQLARSSNRNLTAIGLRRLALRTRNRIIEVLNPHQQREQTK